MRIIFAGDEKRIMCFQEFCGYAMLPHCKFHKALYLYGKGRNGESTLLNVIRALFGNDNSTSLEPSDFADRFSLIDLKDSIVNIYTEAKNSDITVEYFTILSTAFMFRSWFLYQDSAGRSLITLHLYARNFFVSSFRI